MAHEYEGNMVNEFEYKNVHNGTQMYQEYERQKRHIAEWSRSPAEYERRIKELADKLGV